MRPLDLSSGNTHDHRLSIGDLFIDYDCQKTYRAQGVLAIVR